MKSNNIKAIKNKMYWRSLDQLAETPQFKELLHREFPQGASEMNNAWSRRNFMTLMGASLALAGLAGCRRPKEKIVPYVQPPEEVIPGIPQYYATTMPLGTSAYGLVVESHEGRPTKIEGNKLHPSTYGASNALIQASILGLYDPDRSQRLIHKGAEKTWDDFVSSWRKLFDKYKTQKGEGLALLSESFASPTLMRLKREFKKTFPKAKWVTFEPISDENINKGIKIATGKDLQPVYDYDKAKVILSLDADFNLTESENINASRGFIKGRQIESEKDAMNRLYVVETAFSTTGAVADHRLRLSGSMINQFTITLAKELNKLGLFIDGIEELDCNIKEKNLKWIKPLAKDLLMAKGNGLVIAGRRQPAVIHALVYAINKELRNIGVSVKYHKIKDTSRSNLLELVKLNQEINDKKVTALIMLGGNPVYNSPTDLNFNKSLKKVEHSIHLSEYYDESSQMSTWHIPQAHYLESWSDARAANGTVSVVQPLIEPLYGGHSSVELLNLLATGSNADGHEIVSKTWQRLLPKKDFNRQWRKVLHDGLFENSRTKAVSPKVNYTLISKSLSKYIAQQESPPDRLEIVFQSSPSLFDGRFANNGWLQELPDAITKISWDNVARVSPQTAKQLGYENEDLVRLQYGGKEIEMPIWVVPGQADNSVIVELGYGRRKIGRIADEVGFNAYLLRRTDVMDFGYGLKITGTGRKYELANTQDHGSMEGRPLVREATLDEYKKHPDFAPEMVEHPPLVSMWEDHKYDHGYQWGMAIDLTSCTGCNACTIACQSENNIPIVGKAQVRNGREMHWIRVDRYFTGDVNQPEMVHQPVTCQHCELAPCEQVCPVAATVHDDEGLNTMIYNRCVGTRYCSNNCPYKVRRFNFFNFTKETPEIVKMAQNPDVTVRSRGVMEKCTYCIQRINRVKIDAKKENRQVRDGEIVTACQQACPVKAISFGNINDPDSLVSKIKKRNRNYDLLAELNIRPRTSYLAKIRNRNANMPEVS
ncbi:MAG: TAT-variant-translocated molybdopterin oxidoreductase [Candidatus Zixiibacteriota bacterium]